VPYDAAINKAWEALDEFRPDKAFTLKFISDEYCVDFHNKSVLSLSGKAKAKDFTAILILHYLAQQLKGLPQLTGEWVSFKELSGVEGYSSAFRKRAIEPIINKYGANPQSLLAVLERLPAKKINYADIGIVVEVFEGVSVLVTLWRGDEEFGPEVNILFDQSISRIFCTEDIVVLAQFLAIRL